MTLIYLKGILPFFFTVFQIIIQKMNKNHLFRGGHLLVFHDQEHVLVGDVIFQVHVGYGLEAEGFVEGFQVGLAGELDAFLAQFFDQKG